MCLYNACFTIGLAGWGIAWYINGTLIPELVVQRGQTYTFIVYGGDDPGNAAQYHPFYITDSMNGGRLLNTEEQRMVNIDLCGGINHYVMVTSSIFLQDEDVFAGFEAEAPIGGNPTVMNIIIYYAHWFAPSPIYNAQH